MQQLLADSAKIMFCEDQVRRAAVSIFSNIAEGFERNGNKEFIQFLYIAKAPCGEVRAQMTSAKDRGYISQMEFENLYKCLISLSNQIFKKI